jgi:outer membrane lipoprotein-sorting protein
MQILLLLAIIGWGTEMKTVIENITANLNKIDSFQANCIVSIPSG